MQQAYKQKLDYGTLSLVPLANVREDKAGVFTASKHLSCPLCHKDVKAPEGYAHYAHYVCTGCKQELIFCIWSEAKEKNYFKASLTAIN